MQSFVLARTGDRVEGAVFANPCHRIPALAVLPDGRIVVAWDVRADWRDLPGQFDLVVRHSDDGGRSWSKLRLLRAHEGERGFGDASLTATTDGRLLCWYVSSDGDSFFSATPGGSGLGLWLSESSDGGETWTHRAMDELRPGWAGGMFAASGNGVQLSSGPFAGRLLQPFVLRDGAGQGYAAAAWSDDGGASWTLGERVGPDCDENKLLGLLDGSVLMHARATPRRRQAISSDGGASFSEPVAHDALVDPSCNGGICRWGEVLVASLLNDPIERRQLGLRWSADEGRTWSASVPADEGAAGYSVVAPLPDGALAMVYEAGDYEALIFMRIEAGELGEPSDSDQTREPGRPRLVPRAATGTGAAKPPEVAVR